SATSSSSVPFWETERTIFERTATWTSWSSSSPERASPSWTWPAWNGNWVSSSDSRSTSARPAISADTSGARSWKKRWSYMLHEDDRIRLRHMLDAATKAVLIAAGRDRKDLELDDDPLVDALVRLVSVIGEAANRVSSSARSELDGIPWLDVIGMRNRLIHDYYDIDLDILWATVQDSLPALIRSLTPALTQDGKE